MIILVDDNRMSGFAEKIFSDWAYEIETGERESERLFSEVYYDDDPIDCLVTLQRAYSDFCDYFEERLFNKSKERSESYQARQGYESAAGGGRNFKRSLETWRKNFKHKGGGLESVTAEQFMEMAKNGKLPSNLQGQYNNLINKYGLSHDVISAALSDSKDTKNAALNAAGQKMKADRLAGTQAAANVHVKYMNPYQGLQGKARNDGHGGIIILNRYPNTGDVKFDHVSERNAQISGVDKATAKQVSSRQNSHYGNKRQERIDKERETRQKRQEAKINDVLNKDPSKRTQAEERRVNEYLKQQEINNMSKASGRFKNKSKAKAPSAKDLVEKAGGTVENIGTAATLSDQEALRATRDELYKGNLGTTSKSNKKFEMKLANSDSPEAKKALEAVNERREVAKAANEAMVNKEREAAANAQADVEKMVAEERSKANAAAKASTAPAPKPQTNPTRRTPSGGGGGGRPASTAANVAKGEAEGWFKRNRRKLGLAAAALGTLGGGYAAYQHYKDRD
jgi:hypothetical protein